MPKKNLLIIQDSDFLGDMPGGIKSFWKTFLGQMPDDFKVEVVGVSSDLSLRPLKRWVEVNIGGRSVRFLPVIHQKDEAVLSFVNLIRFLIGLLGAKIDYSHKVICFDRLGTAAALAWRRNRKWMIIHCEMDKVVRCKLNRWRLLGFFPRLYFLLENIIYQSLDCIYSTSSQAAESYQKRYPKLSQRINFLPASFETSFFTPASTEKRIIRDELRRSFPLLPAVDKWILYAGRLAEVKDLFLLLDIFTAYHEIDPDSCLLLLGDGPLRGALQKAIVAKQLEKKVFMLGSQTQERCRDFYRASEVFLFTSLSEAGPIVALEALGCGLPVVSTEVGEVKKFVKSGFSGEVRGRDKLSLLEALRLVLENPQRYNAENCRDSVKDYAPQKVFSPLYKMLVI